MFFQKVFSSFFVFFYFLEILKRYFLRHFLIFCVFRPLRTPLLPPDTLTSPLTPFKLIRTSPFDPPSTLTRPVNFPSGRMIPKTLPKLLRQNASQEKKNKITKAFQRLGNDIEILGRLSKILGHIINYLTH